MEFEAVIGLEIHAQLKTKSKIFCTCSTEFGGEPNTQTCPVCIGLPGVLPVLNKKVVESGIKTALATNCTINKMSRFARKNYFYPDLPKGYQISQFELPLASAGWVEIRTESGKKKIGITRIHMEEDAGKLVHDSTGGSSSYVDLNRSSVPLLEIVSEPEISSPSEAGEYLRHLRAVVQYLDVCDGNMEEGSFRCDANVSVKPKGEKKFGTKAEIKNMNSFKNVEKALEYEIVRQIQEIKDGGKIIQETRLWDADRGVTISMRSKEESNDYRYFPEPDLLPLIVDDEWIYEIKKSLPELPSQKKERYVEQFKLPEYDAEVLTSSKAVALFFEEVVAGYKNPKIVSNWIMGELLKELKQDEKELENTLVKPHHLISLLKLIDNGTISGKIAKLVFNEVYATGENPEDIVKKKGLFQVTDSSEIEKIIEKVLFQNEKFVEEYKSGKERLFGYFVGQVMKASGGKANPALLNEILKKKLGGKT